MDLAAAASDRRLRQTELVDRMGRSELHYRALEGDVEGIRTRLGAGDDVGARDRAGFTPLHFAAQQSQMPAAAALLDAGAPVDAQDAFGNTPLWRALFGQAADPQLVRLLTRAGADPDIKNFTDRSPRDMALIFNKTWMLAPPAVEE